MPATRFDGEQLEHAQRYLRDLRLPQGWWLMRAEVEVINIVRRLPLVDFVRLELIGWDRMEVTVEVKPTEFDPEWLYATLLTLPESVPVQRFEVARAR